MRARAAVLAAGLWLSQARAATPEVAVQVMRAADGRGTTVDVRATVDAPLALVERAIAEPGSYPLWMPAVHAAFRDREAVVTEYRLPWPLGRVHERVRMERWRLPGGVVAYAWYQLHGDLRRDEGFWTLSPLGSGKTEVHYRVTFQLHRWVPPFAIASAHRRAGPRLIRNLEAYARSLTPVACSPSVTCVTRRG
jgi:Polyketide cyclase / dehydrase and lipid transport